MKQIPEDKLKETLVTLTDYSKILIFSNKPLTYIQKLDKLIRELRKIENGK